MSDGSSDVSHRTPPGFTPFVASVAKLQVAPDRLTILTMSHPVIDEPDMAAGELVTAFIIVAETLMLVNTSMVVVLLQVMLFLPLLVGPSVGVRTNSTRFLGTTSSDGDKASELGDASGGDGNGRNA